MNDLRDFGTWGRHPVAYGVRALSLAKVSARCFADKGEWNLVADMGK
jgi:hypothetical protein